MRQPDVSNTIESFSTAVAMATSPLDRNALAEECDTAQEASDNRLSRPGEILMQVEAIR
jgi:hypothetical protein